MTDILGHDIDGRPLRAGDEVVIVRAVVNSNIGKRGKAIRYIGDVSGWLRGNRVEITTVLDTTGSVKCNHHPIEWLRKLHSDHRPANQSFEDLMLGLKSGQGVGA